MSSASRGILFLAIITAMVVSPLSVGSQALAGEKIDVSYVVPDTFFSAVICPARMLNSPMLKNPMLKQNIDELQKTLGFDPSDIMQVLVVSETPKSLETPPNTAMVLLLSKSHDIQEVMPEMRKDTNIDILEGKKYLKGKTLMAWSIFMPEKDTLILGNDAMIRKMIENRNKPVAGTMSRVLKRYDDSNDLFAVALVKPIRSQLIKQIEKDPPPAEYADVKKIPTLVDAIGIKLNMSGKGGFAISARCCDDESASELEDILNNLIESGKKAAAAGAAKGEEGADPAQAQMAKMMIDNIFKMFQPVRKGQRVEIAQKGLNNLGGIGMAMLMPALQAARKAARGAQSQNNLKQIGLAMINYENARVEFPTKAICNKDGKPLLSWRVAILPYLGEDELYSQFKLDEPWDSANNKPLIEKMPKVFRSPDSKAAEHTTTYLVPVGPGTMFEGKKGLSIADITDGTADTIMLVEASDKKAVLWTKPADWQYDPEDPLAGLATDQPVGFLVLFCDGKVHRIKSDIDTTVLKGLMTIAGGEVVKDF